MYTNRKSKLCVNIENVRVWLNFYMQKTKQTLRVAVLNCYTKLSLLINWYHLYDVFRVSKYEVFFLLFYLSIVLPIYISKEIFHCKFLKNYSVWNLKFLVFSDTNSYVHDIVEWFVKDVLIELFKYPKLLLILQKSVSLA